jgi:hypothetical protein
MPDLISLPRQVVSRGHPVFFWIPAYAGMTTLRYLTAGVINNERLVKLHEMFGLPGYFANLIGSGARHFSLKP